MRELFEYYLETEQFHFKYAKGAPSARGQEFHDYYEFVLFVNGKAEFISKNIQTILVNNSVVIIPKEHFHQFCISCPDEYIRCVLGFGDIPEIRHLLCRIMNEIKIVTEPDARILAVFEELMEIVQSDLLKEEDKKTFIRSSIIRLVILLESKTCNVMKIKNHLSPIVEQALNLIDENYTADLSVDVVAKALYVSPSTLAHKFSKELHIPLYQYVSKKRLSEAHKRIKNGETYAAAAIKSGFADYSCFYRLYKKYYKTVDEPF